MAALPKRIYPFQEQGITHQQKVTRTYRFALKNSLNWCDHSRFIWHHFLGLYRDGFKANKGLFPVEADKKLTEIQDNLLAFIYQDPYSLPWAEYGIMYQRNAASDYLHPDYIKPIYEEYEDNELLQGKWKKRPWHAGF